MIKKHGKDGWKLSELARGAALITGVALTAYILSLYSFFENLEYKLYDLSFQVRGPHSIEDNEIVIVAIDEDTADSLSYPFNRKYYAELIRKLNKLGARSITFDIQFSSVGFDPEADSIFYAAIEEAGNVVLAGKVAYKHDWRMKESMAEIKPPVKQVAPSGTPMGLANDMIDPDGITRRYPLFLMVDSVGYLTLGLKTYALVNDLGDELFTGERSGDFKYGNLTIPRFEYQNCLLNYYGPSGTFPTYSFIDVVKGVYDFDDMLADLTPEEMEILAASGMVDLFEDSPFKDKIVLVGASAEDLQDNKLTPFFTAAKPLKIPGVEVHANAIQMFIDGRYLSTVDILWVRWGVVILSVLLFLNGRMKRQWMAILIVVALFGLIAIGGIWLFTRHGLWLREMPLLLTLTVGYPTNLVYRFIQIQRDKAMIRGMFSQYLPEKVVDQLIANPYLMKLGGEKRRMSVLFTDVAGFTTVSERLSPDELVALLNEYLTEMSQIISDNEGIIDKYEGDLVMAEFGAPIWYEDHAACCCRAALDMQKQLVEMRRKWKDDGKVELYSRVGINTGEMIVGNMGSRQLFDYTVMGDAVNLSSRFEGANKNYNTTIMIGKETWDDVREDFVTRPLDLLRVKGKTAPVEVFELLAEKPEELSPDKLKVLELFAKGREQYKSHRFEEALQLFQQGFKIDPNDGPSLVYIERCKEYINDPPDENWDGVCTLVEK